MLDMTTIQKQCNSIAKSFNYKTDKRSTILHLKQEIKELNYSKPSTDNNLSIFISNIKDNKEFFDAYTEKIKGSDIEELPDPINIILSHCDEIGIDFETIFMNKLRYNKLKSKYL